METLAQKKEAERLEHERKKESQRIGALISEIKKYQTGIKDIQAKIDNPGEGVELTAQARFQYKRMIEDYKRLVSPLQKTLTEIYARNPPPTQRD